MTVRPHDLGGRDGFGPVPIEHDEPVFHAPWEGTVVAGILATINAGLYNVDQFREGIDDLHPLAYVGLGYYGRWLHTLEWNCVKRGVFTPEELERRISEVASGAPMPPPKDPTIREQLDGLLRNGAPNARSVDRSPRFAAGDRVRGRVLPEERHARIPGFAQGREGIVETVNEAFPFPDSNRRGEGENPEHVYTVVFAAGDLWGSTEARSTVSVDLWESYLEPA